MNFLELAKKRCSVRNFKTIDVEEEKLLKILEAGRVAPTGANFQPHRLLVIQSKEGHEKLQKAANTFDAPLVIVVCGDESEVWKRPYDGKSIIDIDTSIITDHMMLQATELGLGTTWICYFKPDVIKREFNLPKHIEPISILIIGYPAGEVASPDRHDKTRKALKDIVFYETF
jgi:nitroreductase